MFIYICVCVSKCVCVCVSTSMSIKFSVLSVQSPPRNQADCRDDEDQDHGDQGLVRGGRMLLGQVVQGNVAGGVGDLRSSMGLQSFKSNTKTTSVIMHGICIAWIRFWMFLVGYHESWIMIDFRRGSSVTTSNQRGDLWSFLCSQVTSRFCTAWASLETTSAISAMPLLLPFKFWAKDGMNATLHSSTRTRKVKAMFNDAYAERATCLIF